jgi:hypothetical protein
MDYSLVLFSKCSCLEDVSERPAGIGRDWHYASRPSHASRIVVSDRSPVASFLNLVRMRFRACLIWFYNAWKRFLLSDGVEACERKEAKKNEKPDDGGSKVKTGTHPPDSLAIHTHIVWYS